MEEKVIIRNYKNSDCNDILNLLRLNTPKYFSPNEEGDFIYYLEKEIEYYYVIELNEQIVGSGGINISEDKTIGIISWDILHPDFQGKSLGSALLKYRIDKLQKIKGIKEIIVRTSQLSFKFYEKNGFILQETVEDYWDKDFHLYKMKYLR